MSSRRMPGIELTPELAQRTAELFVNTPDGEVIEQPFGGGSPIVYPYLIQEAAFDIIRNLGATEVDGTIQEDRLALSVSVNGLATMARQYAPNWREINAKRAQAARKRKSLLTDQFYEQLTPEG
ncbi:hypothetical protein HY857_02575 [Candidatus Saccharibacteria bacterium]|nr:hypothetical protein [Candidatus Saccharibacteria bacterium]